MVAGRGTSLRRGIQILLTLGSDAALAEGGLRVTQIADLTGHEKSQVSRALSALAEHGLAERSPGSSSYRLGWRCFALAGRAGDPRLIEEARIALARLVDEVGEAAHLSVLQGAEVLTLLTQAPPYAIIARSWLGRTIPAYCTSSGRVLLLDYDRNELIELLGPGPFPARGSRAPADAGELERSIRRARHVGYAVADEESEPGLIAVAAPVRDFTGRVIAAVNVSAPKFRLGARLHPAGELVRAAADQLSGVLGAPRITNGGPGARAGRLRAAAGVSRCNGGAPAAVGCASAAGATSSRTTDPVEERET